MEWEEMEGHFQKVIDDAIMTWVKTTEKTASEYAQGYAIGIIRTYSRFAIMMDAPYEVVKEYYAMAGIKL